MNILSKIGAACCMLFLFVAFAFNASAQTTIIGPANGGNFELGSTFAANNWIEVNTTPVTPTNRWFVGTVSTGSAFTGNRAYISNTAGATYNYDVNADSRVAFYRDITFPAGEPIITLTFTLRVVGEGSYDGLQVALCPTSTSITSSNSTGTGTFASLLPLYSGATVLGTSPAYFSTGDPNGITVTISVPSSFAGTTQRIVFSWRNDTSFGTNPPAAIDDILLTSAAPITYTATALGGLWNSPATWVGGVVPPAGNDVVIPAGSTVTVNQVLNYRDLTVNGNLHFTTVTTTAPIHTVERDLTVGATGNLYWSNASAALNQINIGRDLINNGSINAVTGIITFNGTGNSQISGSGTFEGTGGRGIIRALLAANNGTFTLNQTQNITVTQQINNVTNNFITNGRLRIDNAVDVFQSSVSQVITTAMGSGYTTAPVIAGVGSVAAANWAAGATGVGAVRINAGHQYVSLDAVSSSIAPTHTSFNVVNPGDGKLWLHVGPVGTIGTAFAGTGLTPLVTGLGPQFFYNGALYSCVTSGAMTAAQVQAAMPISTTLNDVITIGAATFRCVGAAATVSYWAGTTIFL